VLIRAHQLTPLVAALWLLAIAALALATSRSYLTQLAALCRLYPQRVSSLVFVLATVAVATLLATGVGLLRPAWWRRAALALALLPAPVLLVTSHNIAAGCAAVALLYPALWLGREFAARLLRLGDPLEAWIIGGAFGVGLLVALGVVLGSLGALRPQFIWPLLLVGLLALLKMARHRLRRDFAGFARWLTRPVVRRPQHFALAGMLLGYLWLNLIGALAPEMYADAVVSRIPASALFARTARFTVDPDLPPSVKPGAGEVLYAVALTVGPLQTAKIVDMLVMVLCAASVWALGRRLGGRRAGDIAAVTFYTLPLTTLLSHTAYLDPFATLFGVTAALLLVLPGRLAWRVAAAVACIGVGLQVKASFGSVAVGLTAALVLLVWRRGSHRATPTRAALTALLLLFTAATVLGGVALLAAAPGIPPDSAITRAIPGLSLGLKFLTRGRTGIIPDRALGTGQSLAALARSPLDLTLHTHQYGNSEIEYQDGFMGYLLLALVPLVVVTRPNRRLAIVLVAAVIAYVVWFSVAQYLRYALPIFALLSAAGGSAYVAASRRSTPLLQRAMGSVLLLLVGLGLLGYLNTTLVYPGNFPYRVVLGSQSKDAYLADNVLGYAAMRLLDAQPAATRALVTHDYARLYTRVRLTSVYHGATSEYRTAGELLQYLDREHFSHIVVDRGRLPPTWEAFLSLNEEFLRRNTMLVGGGRNAYVYRILPAEQRGGDQPWAQGKELLPNGDFEQVQGTGPSLWRGFGRPKFDTSSRESRNGRGAVRTTPDDGYTTDVKVEPTVQYLLSHATRSTNGYGSARLRISWLDATGQPLGAAEEVVPVSPRGYYLHSLLATAPPGTTTARIYAWPLQGEVWFDDVSLRAVTPDR
jgi:hypothetical protein